MTTNESFEAELAVAFGGGRVRTRLPLAPFTTFRVGGPADWYFEPRCTDEVLSALGLAYRYGIPVTLLGGGSNVLIGDRGIRGMVLRPRGGATEEIGEGRVRAEAAVTLNGLVRWTIAHGLSGLEAFAGTPGTVGGAVYGNAHYGGRLIGDRIVGVFLAEKNGTAKEVASVEMQFGYDRSRLQASGEVLLSAVFQLTPGADQVALREVARASLRHRKGTQPLDVPTAGCIFQNPTSEDGVPDGIPLSAGALIDRAGLKGHRCGGARVSEVHANFLVNDSNATAADIRALASHCRQVVFDRFGVSLHYEIVFLGEF